MHTSRSCIDGDQAGRLVPFVTTCRLSLSLRPGKMRLDWVRNGRTEGLGFAEGLHRQQQEGIGGARKTAAVAIYHSQFAVHGFGLRAKYGDLLVPNFLLHEGLADHGYP